MTSKPKPPRDEVDATRVMMGAVMQMPEKRARLLLRRWGAIALDDAWWAELKAAVKAMKKRK